MRDLRAQIERLRSDPSQRRALPVLLAAARPALVRSRSPPCAAAAGQPLCATAVCDRRVQPPRATAARSRCA